MQKYTRQFKYILSKIQQLKLYFRKGFLRENDLQKQNLQKKGLNYLIKTAGHLRGIEGLECT